MFAGPLIRSMGGSLHAPLRAPLPVAPRASFRWLRALSHSTVRGVYQCDLEAFGAYDDDLQDDTHLSVTGSPLPAEDEPQADATFSQAAELASLQRALADSAAAPRSTWLPEENQRRARRHQRQRDNRDRARNSKAVSAASVATPAPAGPVTPTLSAMERVVWEWACRVRSEAPHEVVAADALRPEDLRETFVRGSGKGGQKVNKTASCVMLKHLPTGLAVRSENSRSQLRNRAHARKIMSDKMTRAVELGRALDRWHLRTQTRAAP